MMPTNPVHQQGANINQLQDTAMNVVHGLCSIICRPVEIIVRPRHGTRFYAVFVIFGSSMLMLFLPVFSSVASAALSMIPFTHFVAQPGLFDIASLARLYFLLSIVHGIRHYRRMIKPSLELNSTFEGPPLPFFHLLPGSSSFWFTRIVLEPTALVATAVVMQRMFIFSPGLATYVEFAALAMAMQNYIVWFRSWEFIRALLDMQFAAPIIARMLQNQASDDDLATVHLASFPKNLSPDIHKAAVSYIARIFSPETHASDAQTGEGATL